LTTVCEVSLKDLTRDVEADALVDEARRAQLCGNEANAERLIAHYLKKHPNNATLLHRRALLLRTLDRRAEALELFDAACTKLPGDPLLALARAVTTLEAGRFASALYQQAIQLAPGSTDARLGLAAARLADNAGDLALVELAALLSRNPGWYEGHRQFAQLATLMGAAERAFDTIDEALRAFPNSLDLHQLKINLMLDADDAMKALRATEIAIRNIGAASDLLFLKGVAFDELGNHSQSGDLFSKFGPATTMAHAVRRVRHLVRLGDLSAAAKEIEPWLGERSGEMWPYAALIWRAVGDPRSDWLENQGGYVAIIDLPLDNVQLVELQAELKRLHAIAGRFLDQSVRNGSQTNGPLLARETQTIAQIREQLRLIVATYVKNLPEPMAGHPLLAMRRDCDVRFSGSWSVNLTRAGYHEPHHHPSGWVSGVLYVATPLVSDEHEGNLVISGAPNSLRMELKPQVTVRPEPARLVLFPSFLWHATTPFEQGYRTTIAFDVARPPSRP
jgi:tetratricopeptide (TPR) repeat protein